MSRRVADNLRQARIDQSRQDGPSGPSATGQPDVNGSAEPAAAAGRGRGRGAAASGSGRGRQRRPSPPPPGHESYQVVNMFSITCSWLRQNCPSAWLGQCRLLALFCLSPWYAFYLELGARREHLHVQGVMKCRSPGTKTGIDNMVKHLKGFFNTQPGDNTRILIKLCQSGQTDHYMLGYIQKDKNFGHYEVGMFLLALF